MPIVVVEKNAKIALELGDHSRPPVNGYVTYERGIRERRNHADRGQTCLGL